MLFRARKSCITRLLIVEDEPLVAFDNEHELQSAGYAIVATVDSGEAAVPHLADASIDAVVLDMKLAGSMSGREVARLARDRGIAVLLVTGNCPDDAGQWANAWLAKPYRSGALVEALRAVEDLVCRGKVVSNEGKFTVFSAA
jgi:DNA-binding response OmpR family regulator